MKYCRKSTTEPPSLTTFRAANPQGKWDELRDHVGYSDIRNATRRDQGGLCAYCELSLTLDNEQVAHFHPKSDSCETINWALKWENLWLACRGGTQTHHNDPACYRPPLPENRSCDEHKGDHIVDGHVLSPDEIPLFPRIVRFEQHADRIDIVPDERGCEEAGISTEKVCKTIKAFNLNCTRLSEARLALHRKIEAAVKRLRQAGIAPKEGFEKLASRHLTWDATHDRWPRFFTLLRWRFNSVAEAYLKSLPYQG